MSLFSKLDDPQLSLGPGDRYAAGVPPGEPAHRDPLSECLSGCGLGLLGSDVSTRVGRVATVGRILDRPANARETWRQESAAPSEARGRAFRFSPAYQEPMNRRWWQPFSGHQDRRHSTREPCPRVRFTAHGSVPDVVNLAFFTQVRRRPVGEAPALESH